MAIVACICLTSGARAAEAPAVRPEVLVLVSAPQNGIDRVSIAYARDVGEPAARAELRALLQTTGWKAEGITIDTARLAPNQPKTTSVEFTAPTVVPYPGGVLPVAPFVQTYKSYRSLVLLFQPQRPFRLVGPTSFQDRFLSIRLEQLPGSYRYDVSVTDASFTSLSLPNLPTNAPSGGAGRRRPPLALLLLLAVGGAASVGIAVYLIVASRVSGADRSGAAK